MVLTRFFWKALLWVNAAVILVFWWNGSGEILNDGLPSVLLAVGRLAGLSAAYFILVQFSFMGRMPYLERAFGLDKLSRVHHASGRLGILLLVVHPLLLLFGYRSFTGLSIWDQMTSSLFGLEDALSAFFGLLLFLMVVGTSLFIVRSRVRYESWYAVHLIAYAAVFLAFGHQLALGHDLLSSKFFYGYWITLYTVVFGSHVIFRFLRPIYNFYAHDFRVDRIERESPAAVSIYIRGRNMEKFRARPGQFMIFRFFAKGFWWQAHPFSLSMMPNGKELRVTVKELGDFTKTIKDIPLGTSVLIDGPYGIFTDLFSVSSKVLFVAGGIGITPIRSLMEEMLRKGKDVVLLYGNRNREDIVFERELTALSEKYPARIIQVLSDDPGYEGEKGRIDREKIERLVPDLMAREVYLCGPPPMMQGLIKTFNELGVPMPRIHFEKFELA